MCTKCNKSQHFKTPGCYLEIIKLSNMENKISKCLTEEVWQRYYELQIGPGIQSLGLKRRCKYNLPRKRSWDFTTVTHTV